MKYNDDLKQFFEDAKQRVQNLERDKVKGAGIGQGEDQALRERLYQMIQYGIARQDWYDDQCHRFLQIGLALMGAGVAVCAALVTLAQKLAVVTEWLSWFFGVIIFGTGLCLVYLYNKGIARNHPYRKIADIRSWHFVYTFPSSLPDHLSSTPDVAKRQVNEVIDGLRTFLDRWLELTNDRLAFLKEDLEQVFILQLLQRYRAQRVKQMSAALYHGVVVAALFLLLVFASVLYFGVPATVDLSTEERSHMYEKPHTAGESSETGRSLGDTGAFREDGR